MTWIAPDSRNFADKSASVDNFESDVEWQVVDFEPPSDYSAFVEEAAIANLLFPKITAMTMLFVKVALSLSKYCICWGTQFFSMEVKSIFKRFKIRKLKVNKRARKKIKKRKEIVSPEMSDNEQFKLLRNVFLNLTSCLIFWQISELIDHFYLFISFSTF